MRAERPRDVDDPAGARREAVKILKTRLVSRAALVKRLVRKGFSPASSESAAAAVEGVGLVDDRRLAESLVRRQLGAKAAGKRVLVGKLRQRGIPGAMAELAAADGLRGRDAVSDALDLAQRKARTIKPGLDPQIIQRRLFAYLARRGYEAEVCRAVIERLSGKLGNLGKEENVEAD